MNRVLVAHSHIESADALCRICVEHEKQEMAQMFRNVIARMQVAVHYGDEFNFEKEADEPWNRSQMMAHWIDLVNYRTGFDFEDVDEPKFQEAA